MDLLTGSTGFLGGHLARRLKADGRRLRAIVRPGTDLRRIPPEIDEVVWGELREVDTRTRATAGTEVVFHAAARVSGRGRREDFVADNVTATDALLAAAAAAGCARFVFVSSAGIFGTEGSAGAITDTTPLDPSIEKRGAYAWSKAEADRRVRAFADGGNLSVVVVRPGILYGGAQPPFIARLQIPLPGKARRRLIIGSRDTLLPLTHVENACDAIALAATRGRPGAAYNVIDGTITQGEYLDRLVGSGVASLRPVFVAPVWVAPLALACEIGTRLTGRSLPLSRYRLRRATESLRYETRGAREDLGWAPAVDLAAAIESMRAPRQEPRRAVA